MVAFILPSLIELLELLELLELPTAFGEFDLLKLLLIDLECLNARFQSRRRHR